MGILMQDTFTIHFLFMNCYVCTHTHRYKILRDIVSYNLYLFLPRQFYRKCNLDFPCKLCRRLLFDFLYLVPQHFPIGKFRRSICRKKNFRMDDSGFLCVVMNISCFRFGQFFSRTISRSRNRTFATATADYLNRKMKYRHRTPPHITKSHRRF